jgi:hypothetical protein
MIAVLSAALLTTVAPADPAVPDGYEVVAALLTPGRGLEEQLVAALGRDGAKRVVRFGPEGRRLLARFEWVPGRLRPGETVRVYFPRVASPAFTSVRVSGKAVWTAGPKDTSKVLSAPIELPRASGAGAPLLAIRVWCDERGSFVPEGVDNVYVLRPKAKR